MSKLAIRAVSLAGCMIAAGGLVAGCDGSSGGSTSKSLPTPPKAVVPTTAVNMATTTTTQPKQTVTLIPASGITDGQTVQIAANGFKPNAKSLLVIECADKPDSGAGDCNFGHPPVDADATGNVATTFTVSKGPIGSNKDMCTAAQRCLVVITEAAPNGDNGTAPIVFAS